MPKASMKNLGATGRPRVVWLYPKLTTWMGGARFVFEVTRRLRKKFEVTLACQRLTEDVNRAYRAEGINIINFDSPSFTELSFWINFKGAIRKDAKRLLAAVDTADCIVSSMFPMNCVAAQAGVPFTQIVYEPFAMFFDKNYQKCQSLPVRAFCKIASVLFSDQDISSVNRAYSLLTLSEFERNNCQKVYGRDAVVIYEGVDTSFFYPRDISEIKKRYMNKRVVFHSTGFDSFKGTAVLIKAVPDLVKKIPNVKLLISCTREDKKIIDRYNTFLEREGVKDNVEFLGLIDYELLPFYYSLAELYIEPGLGRSMSLSSKEANACGTPSIRGNVGTEDTIDGETGVLVSPYDPHEVATAISTVLENGSSLSEMGVKAREAVLSRFSWDAVVTRIEQHLPVREPVTQSVPTV